MWFANNKTVCAKVANTKRRDLNPFQFFLLSIVFLSCTRKIPLNIKHRGPCHDGPVQWRDWEKMILAEEMLKGYCFSDKQTRLINRMAHCVYFFLFVMKVVVHFLCSRFIKNARNCLMQYFPGNCFAHPWNYIWKHKLSCSLIYKSTKVLFFPQWKFIELIISSKVLKVSEITKIREACL